MGRVLPGSIFTFIFFLQAVSSWSQTDNIIHHYTNENGLPANGVKSIELDKENGFLWVGTQAGMVRFDGKHFTHFSAPNYPIAASRISVVAKNREGTIYCEDDNFYIYRVKGNSCEFVTTDTLFYPFYQSKRWQALFKTVTQLKGILKNLKPSSFLPPWIVFHDESGDSSSFSFAHFGRAYHYSATDDSLFVFPGFADVLKINAKVHFVDSSLNLWSYNAYLKKLQPVQIKGRPQGKQKNGEIPRLIWQSGMKDPLYISEGNIWKLQVQDSGLSLVPVCSSCSPANADISSAQVWEERGIIFLASEVNGLYVVKQPFLRTIRADITTEAGQAEYAQAELTPGIITTGSGLVFSTQGKILPDKIGKKFHLSTAYKDKNGDHWTNSGDTIIHLRRQGGNTKIPVNDGSERMIFTELGDRLYAFSDIAIAEITGEQYKLLYKLPFAPNDLKNWLNPDAVVELRPGVLAIATEKLMLFDTKKGMAPDTIPIPGLTVKVRALLKYRDYLLIGTYGQGFYIYKDGVVKKMPLDKNAYLNYAHCFMPDAAGYCWISTNHGLFKASLNALVAAYEHDLQEIYYQYFGKDDGIYNTELNGGCQPCALQLSNGLFSFPSMNGVVIIDPTQRHAPPPLGKIFIDEIQADSASYKSMNKALHALSYSLKSLRFKIALPQFGNTENIYFSYKLDPYSDDWESQDIVQNNTLQFGRLSPGDYKLQLRVRNGFEPDQFAVTVVEFRILKPWYQTWWFYLLCFLGFVLVTGALVKWRTARLNRRKKELQRLVTEQTKNLAEQGQQLEEQLHELKRHQARLAEDNKIKVRLIAIITHDLLSPLKFMGFMSKKLRNAFSPSDPDYRTANTMTTVTQDLESLSVNMLNWIRFHYETDKTRPELFNLHDMIRESIEIASTLANEKGINVFNDIPPATTVLQYRQALSVIIYNLVINSVKYTEAGEIRIKGQTIGSYYSLTVSDTGKGMPTELVDLLNNPESYIPDYTASEIKKFQFGYRIIKDLLQLVHGRMSVESTLAKGTSITIEFLLQEESADTPS
jgi:signal transduction histidine kinase